MNKIEKIVYDLVKNNPKVKDGIRNIYQGVLSIVPQKKVESLYDVVCKENYFFGFHDKTPWNYKGDKLLAHKFSIENKELTSNDEVEIGYFNNDNLDDFVSLGRTKSWNWQQGAMLQWVGKKDLIAYNFWDGKNNVCNIIDESGQLVKKLSIALGAIDSQGKLGLGYSFERLNKGMYGYGYLNENDKSSSNNMPHDSFMSLVNIDNGNERKLFSILDIASIEYEESMEGAYHFFTHTIFNPSGNRFLFLHRWFKDGQRLKSRLISSDIESKEIYIFPTGGMVSHFSWINNDKIIAFCNTEKYGDAYYIFSDMGREEYIKCNNKDLFIDGHPQHLNGTSLIITDTYPDRFRIQRLIKYNYENNETDILAKLYSPKQFRSIVRCDLHPRWSRDGKKVCFDSAHSGTRSLCVINLDKN